MLEWREHRAFAHYDGDDEDDADNDYDDDIDVLDDGGDCDEADAADDERKTADFCVGKLFSFNEKATQFLENE